MREALADRRLTAVPVKLPLDAIDDVVGVVSVELTLQAAEGQADDIAVVQLRADARVLAETQPELVKAIDIFGPEARWMRSEIDEFGGAVWAGDFEGERVAGLRKALPGQADAAGQFLRSHARGNADHQARSL